MSKSLGNHEDLDTSTELKSRSSTLKEPLIEPDSFDVEPNKSENVIKMPMRKTRMRFVALAMAALLMFGNNYSFDNPQALQKPIMQDVGVSNPQYNLLYSVFSFPNIFLTLVGGFAIDMLGVRVGIFVFTTMVLVSQTVVAIGGTFGVFWVMLMGRGLFGISSENLIISQSTIISKWFKGSELSVAMGIITTMPEIASALNSFFTPLIYEKTDSLAYPLFTSVLICGFSLVCATILVFLDKKSDKQLEGLLLKTRFPYTEMHVASEEEHEVEEKVSFKDIKEFTATFWILLLVCTLTLGIYIPFLDDANDFMQEKFKFTAVEAGRLLMIPYLVSAFTSPFIGSYVDRVGKRRLFIIIACLSFTSSMFFFGVLPSGEEESPNMASILPLTLLGISFALYSCVIVPSVQCVVEQRVMGTAFGLMGMLESLALATFPLIAASIVVQSQSAEEGYSKVGFFYCGMAGIGLLLACSLYCFDKRGSIILDFINPEKPTEAEMKLLKRYRRPSEDSDEDDKSESGSSLNNDSEDEISPTKKQPEYSIQKSNEMVTPNKTIKDQILGT